MCSRGKGCTGTFHAMNAGTYIHGSTHNSGLTVDGIYISKGYFLKCAVHSHYTTKRCCANHQCSSICTYMMCSCKNIWIEHSQLSVCPGR